MATAEIYYSALYQNNVRPKVVCGPNDKLISALSSRRGGEEMKLCWLPSWHQAARREHARRCSNSTNSTSHLLLHVGLATCENRAPALAAVFIASIGVVSEAVKARRARCWRRHRTTGSVAAKSITLRQSPPRNGGMPSCSAHGIGEIRDDLFNRVCASIIFQAWEHLIKVKSSGVRDIITLNKPPPRPSKSKL